MSEGQQRGSLFAPIHWSDETASSARVGAMVAPANDPFSGQPEATPAAIVPVAFAYRGFVLSRARVTLPEETWWARASGAGGEGLLIASNDAPNAWCERAAVIFGDTEIAEYIDAPRGSYRMAAFIDGQLVGCLFIGPSSAAPQWDAVKMLFETEHMGEAQRRAVLSGKSTDGLADPGPVICAGCHALGGSGGAVGPTLDGVGGRFTESELRAWLSDPQSVKPGTAMPNLALTEGQLNGLVPYLMQQK